MRVAAFHFLPYRRLAAEVGFDALGTNEHHQNPYGFMCNPNLFGAILARMSHDRGLGHWGRPASSRGRSPTRASPGVCTA